MILLFEDDRMSLIARYLSSCYSDSPDVCILSDKQSLNYSSVDWSQCSLYIDFVNGNRNLFPAARELSALASHNICVYIDLIPDNIETLKMYNNFRANYHVFQNKLVIVPISGIEYVYLHSLQKEPFLFLNAEEKEAILNRLNYDQSSFTERMYVDSIPANYEKYLKMFCSKGLVSCASVELHTSSAKKIKQEKKVRNRMYMFTDCCCLTPMTVCTPLLLSQKKLRFLDSLPGAPAISQEGAITLTSWSDLWNTHKLYLEDYNKWASKFKRPDYNPNDHYAKELKRISVQQ